MSFPRCCTTPGSDWLIPEITVETQEPVVEAQIDYNQRSEVLYIDSGRDTPRIMHESDLILIRCRLRSTFWTMGAF